MATISIVEEISPEIEAKMREDLVKYEASKGIEVNYHKLSFILSHNDQVVGVMNVYTAYAEVYINDMWVETTQRGKGYGKTLIDAVKNHFKSKGFNNINLVTSAFQAPEFYQKCGFKLEFVRKNLKNPMLDKYFFVYFFEDEVQKQGIL